LTICQALFICFFVFITDLVCGLDDSIFYIEHLTTATEVSAPAQVANLCGTSAVRTFTHFIFLPLLDESIVSYLEQFVKKKITKFICEIGG
jgi:hypothetical protein